MRTTARNNVSIVMHLIAAASLLGMLLMPNVTKAQQAQLCSICRNGPPSQFLAPDGSFDVEGNETAALEWQRANCLQPRCFTSVEDAEAWLTDPSMDAVYLNGSLVCRPGGNNCQGGPGSSAALDDPLGNASIPAIIGRFTNLLMGITGSVALLMFVWGGFRMVTSQGNDKVYAAGLNSMKWAGIGLVVIFASYAALTFILNVIGSSAA
jgi:hypothetical protein